MYVPARLSAGLCTARRGFSHLRARASLILLANSGMSDKLQFVVFLITAKLDGINDKLKFVGHLLTRF
jgi:hypothetical protein